MTNILLALDTCATFAGSNTIGKGCPHCNERHTPGSGYATDFMCGLMDNRITSSYVESPSEMKQVPIWCPLIYKE